MLVILMPEQIIVPSLVCQSCLLADNGQPRWRNGKLYCGQQIRKLAAQQPDQYKCLMGFYIANIN